MSPIRLGFVATEDIPHGSQEGARGEIREREMGKESPYGWLSFPDLPVSFPPSPPPPANSRPVVTPRKKQTTSDGCGAADDRLRRSPGRWWTRRPRTPRRPDDPSVHPTRSIDPAPPSH